MSPPSHAPSLVSGWFAHRPSIAAVDEDLLLANVEAALFRRGRAAPPAPLALGRYRPRRRIAAGGGGTVYQADDPQLDRRVAIKVLTAAADDEGGVCRVDRLRREATVLGAVCHPNVVTVYDVVELEPDASGRIGVVVVMEWIEGVDLARWLAAGPHPPERIIEHFMAAGQGLAAAHRAGIVHRDFKPSNVVVDEAGRVRVVDFGLARHDGVPPRPTTPTHRSNAVLPQPALTIDGAVLGTPAYMAPEQHRGQPADERADQFAFCASLFQALSGELPFSGKSLEQLEAQKCKRPAVAGATAIPGRLARVIARGLDPDPDRRYPSMDRLLARLQPRPRRGRRALIAAGLATFTAGGLWAMTVRSGETGPCEADVAELDAAWGAEQRKRSHAAFANTGLSYAEDSWTRVDAKLSAYGQAWLAARRTVCEAPDAANDPRLGCLRRRLWDLRGLGPLLADADAEVVARSLAAASRLPPIDACLESDAGATVPRVADRGSAGPVDAQRERLASARALRAVGRYDEALTMSESVVNSAAAIEFIPLAVEARRERGAAQVMVGELEAAREDLEYAFWEAASIGYDEEAGKVASDLAFTVGYKQARLDRGRQWARHGDALLARLGRQNSESAAVLLSHRGSIEALAGRYDVAREHHERSLEIRRQIYGELDQSVASSLNNLANVLLEQGELQQARQFHQRALELRIELLGPGHPIVGVSWNNLGSVLLMLGEAGPAKEHLAAALVVWERALGPEHPDLIPVLTNLAVLSMDEDEFEAAEAQAARALHLGEIHLGRDHPSVIRALNVAGLIALDRGDVQQARVRLERARDVWRQKLGPDHSDVASAVNNVGLVLREAGDLEGAQREFESARAVWSAALGPDHQHTITAVMNLADAALRRGNLDRATELFRDVLPRATLGQQRAEILTGLARIALREGEPDRAVTLARDGAAHWAKLSPPPMDSVITDFVLARALWATAHRTEALTLARSALARCGDQRGRTARSQREAITRWLDTRVGRG